MIDGAKGPAHMSAWTLISAEAAEDIIDLDWDALFNAPARPYGPPTRMEVIRTRLAHAWAALHGSGSECDR